MRLLLDTNILIPIARHNTDTLKPDIRSAIRDARNTLFASVASLWEITIKFRIGKLEMALEPEDVPAYLTDFGMELLTIGATHVVTKLETSVDIRDPFDRVLLAQCQAENLRLVTIDPKLLAHPMAWRAG